LAIRKCSFYASLDTSGTANVAVGSAEVSSCSGQDDLIGIAIG